MMGKKEDKRDKASKRAVLLGTDAGTFLSEWDGNGSSSLFNIF